MALSWRAVAGPVSVYRGYLVTVASSEHRDAFYCTDFAGAVVVLRRFDALLCGASCVHVAGGLEVEFARVWFADGFLTARPNDFVPGIEHAVSVCPREILGALNG